MKTRLLAIWSSVRSRALDAVRVALSWFKGLPKRLQWLALALLVLFLLMLMWFLRGQGGDSAGAGGGFGPRDGRPVPVAVAEAKEGDLDVILNGLGTVTALNTVTVKPRVDGQLQRILFKEGQQVKAGEVLAELDLRSFQIAVEQARGQLIKDQALLANARIDLERYRSLLEKEAASRQQVDTQAALVRQYEGTVKGDQAQVDNALLQLDFARVKAPVAGRLGLRQVDLGNMVKSSDANGIVVLTQTQPISVVFALSSEAFPPVLQRWLNGETLRTEAWSRDSKQALATGKLLTVDNQIDSATGTVKLKAVFENTDNALFPNQFVNVRLRAETRSKVVLIPEAALQRGTQGPFVYRVVAPTEAPSEDGKPVPSTVEMRKITPGPSEGGQVVVEEGLAAGDKVVIDGLDKLRQGAKVMVADPAARKPGAGKGGKGGKGAPNAQGGKGQP